MSGSLQLDDWGGTGPVLHLASANGFPPGTYRKLISYLTPRFRVVSLRMRPLVPGSEPSALTSWGELADELIQGLREHGLEGVTGVGHSMGGVYTLLAAAAHPASFRSVVALDPVLFTGARARVMRVIDWLGVTGRVPPARLAYQRRDRWGSREEAAASYRRKPLFRGWDPDCFQDYLIHGLTESPGGGIELRIPKRWEARIFETYPHFAWSALREVAVPVLVLRGGDSDTLTPDALKRLQRELPRGRTEELPGTSHLFPMEQPEECGRRILSFLDEVEAQPSLPLADI